MNRSLHDSRARLDPSASHTGAMAPTGKGISVNVIMIPKLRAALADAEARAVALGWLLVGDG